MFSAGSTRLDADAGAGTALERVVATACELTGAQAASLVLLDGAGAVGRTVTLGVAVERRRFGPGAESRGMLGALVGSRRSRRVEALDGEAGLVTLPRTGGPAPFVGAPVTLGEQTLGALCLSGRAGAPFTDRDEELVALLATQAALAIDNAALLCDARLRALVLDGLREVTDALLGGSATYEVLSLLLRRVRELVGAGLGFVAVSGPSPTLTILVADGPGSPAMVGRSFPGGPGTELLPPVAGATVVVPLVGGGRQLGALCLADLPAGRHVGAAERLAVDAFAAQAAVLLRDAQLRRELHRMSTLEERERIARDLHDDVVQTLFVAGLSLQAAELGLDGPDHLRPRIADAVASIDGAIRNLRQFIFGLNPGDRAEPDLGRNLRDLADTFRLASGLPITVVVCPEASGLLLSRLPDVVHFAREAVSNAVRHSRATELRICLSLEGGGVRLDVVDNGIGFDVECVPGTGTGLVNLRARAAALGGMMTLTSWPDQGTSVVLLVPVSALAPTAVPIAPGAARPS